MNTFYLLGYTNHPVTPTRETAASVWLGKVRFRKLSNGDLREWGGAGWPATVTPRGFGSICKQTAAIFA